MTGLTVILVRESAHQSLTWSSRTRRWPSSMRPVGPNTVARSSRVASKWAWRTTSRAAGRCWRSAPAPARSSAVWVRARSPRAADAAGVERRVGSEGLQRRGAVGEGPVEVEGVGDVELGLEPHRAGEVDVVVVDRGVARVDVEVAVLRVRGRVGLGEVVALDRLRDEPVQLRRHRCDRRPRRPARRRTPRPPGSGRGSGGWWSPRPSGPAMPGPVRRGPAPTAAGGGGAARGRGRRASSPRSSRYRGRCRARRGRTPPPAAHPHPRWAPRARSPGR